MSPETFEFTDTGDAIQNIPAEVLEVHDEFPEHDGGWQEIIWIEHQEERKHVLATVVTARGDEIKCAWDYGTMVWVRA